MEIIERIYECFEQTGKKPSELCETLGIRQSTMSSWKSRKNDPPACLIKAIANFFDVSTDYLLTGRDTPAPKTTTQQEGELLELFRHLPESRKYEFIGELKGFLRAYDESEKYADKDKKLSA